MKFTFSSLDIHLVFHESLKNLVDVDLVLFHSFRENLHIIEIDEYNRLDRLVEEITAGALDTRNGLCGS